MKILFLVILLSITSCTSSNKKESTGQYLDSTVITTKVKTKILQDNRIKFLDINVETYKGVVQLSGFVSSSKEKSIAEEVAKSVEGVTKVENDIKIK